jgi:HD-GYP domain-containing protein (c-di-GMP phosphodiesterase class II)
MTVRVAKELGLRGQDLVDTRRGALLHDIGKIGIPDSILLKPGPLTEDEWAIMRRHPVLAFEILYPITYLQNALVIPYFHHERWDGAGYPQGVKGDEIPLAARAFAVVDVFDALTCERPYRPPWPKSRAIGYIREESGRHFDPSIVATFLRLMSES